MAKPITDDEIQLRKRARRRLVGAIALVLVVVVVLPWLVDDEPPPQLKNVDISIPPVDSADRKFPPAAPVGEPLAAAPGEAAAPAPEAQTAPAAESAPTTPVPASQPDAVASVKSDVAPLSPKAKPVVETPTEPKPDAKPVSRPESKPATAKGFIMQIGAFSTAAKAKQVQQQLKSAGVPSYIEPVETPTGTRHRVKAGPFASNEAALKAREKLQAAKLAQGDPKVVPVGQ
jgi:DedD protein